VLSFAGFELDQERARLRGPDGEAIKLRPKSFDMLQLFATNAGRVLSKQDLIEAIWPKVHVGDDSLFQCIREIRTALGDEDRQLIKLVSGRGYLFEAEVSVEQGGATASPEVPQAPGSMTPVPWPANGELRSVATAPVEPPPATNKRNKKPGKGTTPTGATATAGSAAPPDKPVPPDKPKPPKPPDKCAEHPDDPMCAFGTDR